MLARHIKDLQEERLESNVRDFTALTAFGFGAAWMVGLFLFLCAPSPLLLPSPPVAASSPL